MIGHLRGSLVDRGSNGGLLVDVSGIGYEVNCSVGAFASASSGDEVHVHTHLVVREDAQTLYGFSSRAERDTFRILIATHGVGPALGLALLATLDPRPGRQFLGEKAAYITPDVYVHKVGDEYKVIVNDDGLPKLRVSQAYQNALTGGAGKEAKDYLSEKMRAATWLIRSIHQRQNTIQRVTEAIMRVQRPFLEQGVKALKPLVLREIADEVGLHESTVSRVTTNKYVHTPQGIYELKFFFNSRITTAGSGADNQ